MNVIDKNDEILIKQTQSRLHQCEDQCILTHSSFLDVRQSTMLENLFQGSKHILYGGYEDAERRIMVFLPDYLDEIPEDDNPLEILRVSHAKGGKPLAHKDYLGSILGLGVDRNVTGDILVREAEADIVILKSMEDFFLTNYNQAGRTSLSVQALPISEINLGEIHVTEKRGTVASLRLDNLVSEGFNISRSKAQEAVKSGLVYVNNLQDTKSDRLVSEGDKIVLRGCGKIILKEIGNETRKGRLAVLLLTFNS